MDKVAVLIPCYNEAKTIKKVLFRQDIVAGSDQVLQDLDEERGI